MDRSRRRTAAALILAGYAVCGPTAAAPEDSPLRAMQWLAPGANLDEAIASAPAECLRPATTEAERHSREIGRAAFRSALVLGGVAARAGISCDSCHRSGRDNPDFQFQGVSGPPGTADVTNSLFSSHRADGIDNPRPIPNLSGPKSALKIDQAPASASLEPFIHGLIVEEFDGPEPTPATLAGLADYVRALAPQACPAAARTPVSVSSLVDDARRAVVAAGVAAGDGDLATAVQAVASARGRLGLIDERFADPGLTGDRQRLRRADAGLAQIQAAMRRGRPAEALIGRWLAQASGLDSALTIRQDRSLFSSERVAGLRRAP